ncbi:UxaA family hydrolase [Natrarchaeobius sp. A-rgal3]|uniref:UxaA family hydrolase n=1 Tax=Natrarchaeobius versutus TaxID=1679078 RepID=UPI00350F1AFF
MKGEVIDDRALVMAEGDTVATAIEDLEAGVELRVDGGVIELGEDVEFGHKIAITAMDRGDRVRKYGEVIGAATREIEAGEWVHTHNCESMRGRGDVGAGEDERVETDGAADATTEGDSE